MGPVATIRTRLCAGIATCALVTVACSALVIDFRHLDQPLCYRGDALAFAAQTQSLIQGGSFYRLARLNAPHELDFRDYPAPELHWIGLGAISAFTKNPFLVINVYFIAALALASICTFLVLRSYGVRFATAVVCGVLFAFAPYVATRQVAHLALSCTFVVPLACWMALSIVLDDEFVLRRASSAWRLSFTRHWKAWLAVVVALLIPASSGYYAVFTCLLIVFAAMLRFARERSWRPVAVAVVLCALVGASLAVCLIPTISRRIEAGPNQAMAERKAYEAEAQGLKLLPMVMPRFGHRLHSLRQLNESTAETFRGRWTYEHYACSIGTIASVAFLGMMLRTIVWRWRPEAPDLVDACGWLAILVMLFASSGGLAPIVSTFVISAVRVYARFAIYLQFFAVIALAAALSWIERRCAGALQRTAFLAALSVLLAAGVFDQTTPIEMLPVDRQQFRSDQTFFRKLEDALPPDASVFCLPVVSFPEHPPLNEMAAYDFMRAHLGTDSLRFSFGPVLGRPEGDWQRPLANLEPAALIDAVADAGFDGLLIDRFAYADQADSLVAQLQALLGEPLVSRSNRDAFFSLRPLQVDRSKLAPEARQARLRHVLNPARVSFAPPSPPVLSPRDCRFWHAVQGHIKGDVLTEDESARPHELILRLRGEPKRPLEIRVQIDGQSETLELTADRDIEYSRDVILSKSERATFRVDLPAAATEDAPPAADVQLMVVVQPRDAER